MAKGKKTGGGSRKGKPNKFTADLDAMIDGALHAAGGEQYLLQQAKDNPNAFLALIGKRLVKSVKVGGDPENPVRVNHAINPRALQSANDLIRFVVGLRANPSDAPVSQDGSVLPAPLRDGA